MTCREEAASFLSILRENLLEAHEVEDALVRVLEKVDNAARLDALSKGAIEHCINRCSQDYCGLATEYGKSRL